MLALPRTTVPPVGNCVTGGGDCAPEPLLSMRPITMEAKAPVETDRCWRVLLLLPAVFACSGTACHVCVATDHKMRKTRFKMQRPLTGPRQALHHGCLSVGANWG